MEENKEQPTKPFMIAVTPNESMMDFANRMIKETENEKGPIVIACGRLSRQFIQCVREIQKLRELNITIMVRGETPIERLDFVGLGLAQNLSFKDSIVNIFDDSSVPIKNFSITEIHNREKSFMITNPRPLPFAHSDVVLGGTQQKKNRAFNNRKQTKYRKRK